MALIAVSMLCASPQRLTAAPIDRPRDTGDVVFLSVGGSACGFPQKVSGGEVLTNSTTSPRSKFSNITMQLDFPLPAAMCQWISNAWQGKAIRNDGTLTYLYATKPTFERQFTGASIIETTVPGCDGSSKG